MLRLAAAAVAASGWLAEQAVASPAMAASPTGDVVGKTGLAVQLVNSSQARNLPGRPKTDKEDARWIARLTEMGMLQSAFVPPPEISHSPSYRSRRSPGVLFIKSR
jgi:hypothetical protein